MTALQPDQIIGSTATDPSGDKIGKIGQVYFDDESGQPTWITVSTGLFGSRESFAPLSGANWTGDNVALAVTKDQVKDAPNVDDDEHISPTEEQALFQHYSGVLGGRGSGYAADTTEGTAAGTSGHTEADPQAQGTVGGPGQDTSGPNTDDAMTRSEEQLNVGTEQVETGRARLRKYVVTENVTQTVPVSHEEVRIEREPITDANVGSATDGPAISEEEHEVTLHAERPVVDKQTVPVERVRMGTETVTGEEQVSDTVRKEQIDVDGDDNRR